MRPILFCAALLLPATLYYACVVLLGQTPAFSMAAYKTLHAAFFLCAAAALAVSTRAAKKARPRQAYLLGILGGCALSLLFWQSRSVYFLLREAAACLQSCWK